MVNTLLLLNTVLPPPLLLITSPDGAYDVCGGEGTGGRCVDTGGSDDDDTVCNNLAAFIVRCT